MAGGKLIEWRMPGSWPCRPFNPYWDRSGRTFEDPDGYRVVIQRASWSFLGTSALMESRCLEHHAVR